MRKCNWCGLPLKPWQRFTCSIECRDLARKKYRQQVIEEMLQGKPKKAEAHLPKLKKYKSPISDKEQFKLNLAIDARYKMEMSCRVIKPGDPDFDKLCAEITPIERIRKTERNITIWGDIDLAAIEMSRRKEETTKLYE